MFWGVTIENDKRYTQTVEASFHLSMAALNPNPPTNLDTNTTSTVSLWLQHDKAEFLLCTLEYGMLYQQPLDCNFTEGEEVTFFLNGQGVIHLTGYLIEDMSMADDSMEEPMISSEDDSEESDDIPVLVDAKQLAKGAKKRTKEMKMGSKKKCKVEGEIKDSDESSDDESETGDDDDEDDEEEDSSEEDIPEDSDDSDHEKVTSKKAQKAKSEVAKKNVSNSLKQAQQTKEQKLSKKLTNKEQKALANSNRSDDDEDSLDKTLLDASISSEKKKKKKKKKQTKVPEASDNKQELSTQSEESKSLGRVLSSGLVIEDTQVGQGSEARIGRQVHVYYSGKLAKNGKMFDRCINGKPFRFTLGRGEVISGWEKGLVGMRVGGKRTLSIPAKLGYGSQKAGPIPPNSSLIFDIELKAIS